MNKCVFLDRDGVLNRERGDYTYNIEDFEVLPKVAEALKILKKNNFLLIVITNQAGISREIYTREQMNACHDKLQDSCNKLIDAIYYCPYHPSITASIARKPDTLMFEKSIVKYNIDVSQSWMIGDKERDMIPAASFGIKTILIDDVIQEPIADFKAKSLINAVEDVIIG